MVSYKALNTIANPIRADYYFKTPHDISKIL
jgi:hypothetical protein